MKRGEIWVTSDGKDYAGKPRPVVIVQDDSFDATDSVTICAFTTAENDAPLIGQRVGRLDVDDMTRLGQAMLVFLGLAVSSRRGHVEERDEPA